MPVVSVINYKGGVGKTTLTANLGAELAARGRNILLIDLDPQTSLTFSFVLPDEWATDLAPSGTIKEWFESHSSSAPLDLQSLIFQPRVVNRVLRRQYAGAGKLSLISSHLGLINVDLELATELGGGSIAQSKRNYLRVHQRLANGLQGPGFDEFDLILIDCPPNFNVVTKTAIVASDSVLIPAKADYLSTLGIDYLQRNLTELVADYNEYATHNDASAKTISPDVLGVVFTMIQVYANQPISAQRPFIAQTSNLGVAVFDAFMRENKTLFGEASQTGIPVVLDTKTTQAHIVAEMEALATEFECAVGI